MKLSAGDRVRIGLAPLHVVAGGALVYHFATDARAPMVLVMGLAFITFGLYKIALIRRGLKK